MSQINGNSRVGDESERLVVIRVVDAIEPKLTARVGVSYESPAQTREQAMTLVRLLLGRSGKAHEEPRWSVPIAGGRRVVTMTEQPAR